MYNRTRKQLREAFERIRASRGELQRKQKTLEASVTPQRKLWC